MTLITFKKILLIIVFIFCSSFAADALSNNTDLITSKIKIKVGSGERPPFFIGNASEGAGPEIINVLNLVQNQYTFEIVAVPIKRRTQSLTEGWVDIVMWDNINWGWDDFELEASVPLVYSKDLFIAKVGNEQSYFDDFSNKRIVAVHGYHYKFVEYETNVNNLRNKFDISLVRTEEDTINMLIKNKADISIVSNVVLDWFLLRFPEVRERIVRSELFDTEYVRQFLIPKSAPITAAELNQILKKADDLGLLDAIYKKYALIKPDF